MRDAPAIAALATELAGPLAARDWPTVATALLARVTVDTSVTAPDDAPGTLGAGRGRPDGLARLFVAVVQAGGGDARYVVGVAPRGDTLHSHAWAEVRDPARRTWEAVDPVRGGRRAATDLIRLAWGGSSHPDDLMPYVADVRFTPVSAASTEPEEQP
jgi:transglutaminase-like putative cysteine protease